MRIHYAYIVLEDLRKEYSNVKIIELGKEITCNFKYILFYLRARFVNKNLTYRECDFFTHPPLIARKIFRIYSLIHGMRIKTKLFTEKTWCGNKRMWRSEITIFGFRLLKYELRSGYPAGNYKLRKCFILKGLRTTI